MTNCLSCGTEIDIRRAPAARVMGGTVVSFCSEACANKAQPPRTPRVTASIQPDDIVGEAEVPVKKRARTEPPKPPPGSDK